MTNSQKIVLQGFADQSLAIVHEIENLDIKLNKTNNAIDNVEVEISNLQFKLNRLKDNRNGILKEKDELKKTLDFVNDKCVEISGKNIEDLFEVVERKHAKGTKLVAVFKDNITGPVEEPNEEDSQCISEILREDPKSTETPEDLLPGTPDVIETPEDACVPPNYDPADDMPNF